MLVAGDVLGTIVRPGFGHSGWIARDTSWTTLPHRGDTGRYATNQQHAVADLIAGLRYTGSP